MAKSSVYSFVYRPYKDIQGTHPPPGSTVGGGQNPTLWIPLVNRHPQHAAYLSRHNLPTSKHGADPCFQASLHPMLFICLAHGPKGGDVRCMLDVQKSSQSDKPIFKCPFSLISKIAETHLHRTDSLVCMLIGVQWVFHQDSISYIYPSLFKRKKVKLIG
jgi:hypothetical protein